MILVKYWFVFPVSGVLLFFFRFLILSSYLYNQFRQNNYSNEHRLSEVNEADVKFNITPNCINSWPRSFLFRHILPDMRAGGRDCSYRTLVVTGFIAVSFLLLLE